MRVKCKICGLKGTSSINDISEYHASRFLFVSKFLKNKHNSYYVCRKCVKDILSSLELEQYRIDKLYEPEIKGNKYLKTKGSE